MLPALGEKRTGADGAERGDDPPGDTPVVRLIAIDAPPAPGASAFGTLHGQIVIADDYMRTLWVVP